MLVCILLYRMDQIVRFFSWFNLIFLCFFHDLSSQLPLAAMVMPYHAFSQ